MLTKALAQTLSPGKILHHVSIKTRSGPIRCRVNGKCKTWKTRPNDFQLPVKYGLKTCFYITPQNAADWTLA